MSDTTTCICCGSHVQVERTDLTRADKSIRTIYACEECADNGRIFDPETWDQSIITKE